MTGSKRQHGGPRAAGADSSWHLDSSLPAAEALSELPGEADLEVPELVETPSIPPDEAPTELPWSTQAEGNKRRGKTIARKQMLRERRRMIAEGRLPEILDYDRPMTRSDCRNGRRPCLYVSCRYHLYLDVNPKTGSIKINFPDLEVWQMTESCALDVAERGGVTLEEVGDIMNLTRERIRQVESAGLGRMRSDDASLEDFLDGSETSVADPDVTGFDVGGPD